MERSIRFGVSSCLLGQAVRYDGGHKRDRFVTGLLGGDVEWVPVCPELESGLGVPRPPVHLVRDGRGLRMVEALSGRDHSARMRRFAARRVRALRALELCGYVLKADSPSCGMARVKVYGGGAVRRVGRGLFADALMRALPSLPVEEEGRLADPALRERFVERAFAYRRVSDLFRGRWTPARVAAFHAAHELQLLAHAPAAYTALRRLAASAGRQPRARFRARYTKAFMDALARVATRGRNVRVLRRAAGHLEAQLDAAERGELAALIDGYHRGAVLLGMPIARLRHHARAHAVAYLEGQSFLDPRR